MGVYDICLTRRFSRWTSAGSLGRVPGPGIPAQPRRRRGLRELSQEPSTVVWRSRARGQELWSKA